ncbi:DUF3035 domain-containing protein [Jannaschia sp. W003]|uniref:DUF3035 domain-containing protein n=1 Tax=Jannaschia sp. W003 TaxID=2867012 RepID=UPI0021A78431|nr:DUF3035 domain-containing protein [Jannaschia sp. W003]UWQ21435.1 DUF3035 domain-containing protein [Jannaschia sp. W003]
MRLAALPLLALLAACAREEPRLLNLSKADRTPDEFSIVPSRPLEQPPTYAALPAPLPGGPSRADPAPEAAAVAALGGRPGAGAGADPALAARVFRYGVGENIRGVLAAEDLAFRRRNDPLLLERLFNVNVYYDAYRPLSLDQHRELERLRALGVRTVAAPPDPR